VSDHDYASAARALNVSRWWLEKHLPELPHIKYGSLVRFTDAHLDEIRARFEKRPGGTAPETTAALRPSTRRRAS
jgi:hypothetical protein